MTSSALFVPYEAMRRDFPMQGPFDTPDSISAIIVAPHAWVADTLREQMDSGAFRGVFSAFGQTVVEKEIRQVLAPLHGFDVDDTEALSLWNTAVESVMFSKVTQAMKNFFVAVSLITLALGGIGVMNIMLVAVRERTREIGLRKAIGATSRSIHRQFIIEGLALTVVSGALGFVVGLGFCALINLAPTPGAVLRDDHHSRDSAVRSAGIDGCRSARRPVSRGAGRRPATCRIAQVRGLRSCGFTSRS